MVYSLLSIVAAGSTPVKSATESKKVTKKESKEVIKR
jgi:hypothetical protein